MNAKKTTQRQGFKTSEFIVYPAHGVGQIVSIEEQEVAGARLELFVINFVKDKMTLRVPTSKIASVGMRKLAETEAIKEIEAALAKGPHRGPKPEADEDAVVEEEAA
jgi:CarD family transcriptional regulator